MTTTRDDQPFMRHCILALLTLTMLPAAPLHAQSDDDEVEEITVTGVRGKPRSTMESPVAVDVFSAEQLEVAPQVGLFESLRFLVPSLQMPQRPGGGTATFIASAGLRGLNPDQTLVLVNGKRRHRTALINTSTGQFSGSAGVDLNMIPRSAIKQIEVLRDGAAAQYGSDAIAGVVNIILNDGTEGGRFTASAGENFDRGDGEFLNSGVNFGLPVGDSGFINFSLDFMDSGFSNRAEPVPIPDPANPAGLNLYPLLPDGSLDPREFSIDRLVTSNYGNFPRRTYAGAINFAYDLDGVELYSFATFADRDSILDFTFRRPRDSRAIPEIFPQGFRPRELISEKDYEIVAGVRGMYNDWEWDLSMNAGENESSWRNTRGLNASLGALSPTSFFLGKIIADEFNVQLDVTRAYSLDDAGELQVSFGTQFRDEAFEITEGEPLSYADGNNGLAPGAQGFPGFAPEAVNDLSRNNFNAYVELGWDPTDRLFLGAALRYEDFDDSAGEEVIGKISARYAITEALALRGSVNTGFRAPSVQQLGFRGSRGQFQDLDNDGIAETIVLRQTLPSTDPAAQALGAEPLVPETSTNFSFGLTWQSDFGLDLTVDFYRIDIDDRIALSTQFNRGDGRPAQGGGTIGDQISALLDAAGFDESLGGLNYFTNAIDTRSQGVDVVATWGMEMGSGSLTFTGAYNYNDLSVESVDPNPDELSGLILADGTPIVQFDRSRLGTYTDEFADSMFSLGSVYTLGGFVTNLRATRFGEFTNVAASEENDTANDAEWIVDLELGYEFQNGFSIYAGANNVFNTYPERVRPSSSLGNGFYDTISPYGFTGGSWYVRTTLDW
jgi:iron complex outermembrane receptor protein